MDLRRSDRDLDRVRVLCSQRSMRHDPRGCEARARRDRPPARCGVSPAAWTVVHNSARMRTIRTWLNLLTNRPVVVSYAHGLGPGLANNPVTAFADARFTFI